MTDIQIYIFDAEYNIILQLFQRRTVRSNCKTSIKPNITTMRHLPPKGYLAGFFIALPLEGPGVVFPELVGVAGFDTGVVDFSFCND